MPDNPRIEELRRRVQKDPASIAFAQLAEEYRRTRQYAEAVDVCRAGLARHSSYLSARVTLGRALIELHEYEEAQAELEQVLRSAPENLAAIRGLAEIHQRRGELDDALRQYQTALAIARHDPDIEQSVDELRRQLGEAPPPTAPTSFDDPAPPALEGSTPAASDASAAAARPTPGLEAAADEFTKALQALDAMTIDLPVAPLPAVSLDLPTPDVEDVLLDARLDASGEEDGGAVAEPEERPDAEGAEHGRVTAAASEDAPQPPSVDASAADDDPAIAELESWLDAIEADRAARGAARS